uniref:Uncharacterized protein n=1 Tax=Brassica oleracea TaxID=3712 RepID=A0A3P6C115_BRAOL|nr:unnamed protein product [Brassica oleracea]
MASSRLFAATSLRISLLCLSPQPLGSTAVWFLRGVS